MFSTSPTYLSLIYGISGPTALAMVALMVITDKLVWHTRLKAMERRAEMWEKKALELLGVAQVSVHAAEVSARVISKLPDPVKDEEAE